MWTGVVFFVDIDLVYIRDVTVKLSYSEVVATSGFT